jgi:hypothetical protein
MDIECGFMVLNTPRNASFIWNKMLKFTIFKKIYDHDG